MARKDDFEITWEAHDGYVVGSAPQHVRVCTDEIDDDATDADLEELFDDVIQQDFEQKVSWSSEMREEFVAWAKKVIAERNSA